LFDQNTQQGIPLKFLNRTCAVTNLPGIIAQRFHADARIFWAHRTGFWRCELKSFKLNSTDAVALTEESNAWLAGELGKSDDLCADWLWAHNRWKGGDQFNY
jgi:lauroyl/myristoyl acyltransferase